METPLLNTPTFLDNFAATASQALRELLEAVPELELAAVIPVWRIPGVEISGLIRQATGSPLLTPDQELRLIYQIHRCLTQRVRQLGEQLGSYDALAGDIAKHIKEGQAELERINALRAEAAGCPGTTADGSSATETAESIAGAAASDSAG